MMVLEAPSPAALSASLALPQQEEMCAQPSAFTMQNLTF